MARVKNGYGKTSKIKEKALSWNQRQENQNEYYTKTLCWISSKLTPADASRTGASFCIWSQSHLNSTVACIAQSSRNTCNSTTIKYVAVQKKITHLMVSKKALLPHSQKCSRASSCQIEQYQGLQEGSPPQIFLLDASRRKGCLRPAALFYRRQGEMALQISDFRDDWYVECKNSRNNHFWPKNLPK